MNLNHLNLTVTDVLETQKFLEKYFGMRHGGGNKNIAFLTDLGLRVYTEDVLRASKDPDYSVRDGDGNESFAVEKFFKENLSYPENQFDAVLVWDATDYLPEPLVTPY